MKYKVKELDDGGRLFHMRNDVTLEVHGSTKNVVDVLMKRHQDTDEEKKGEPDAGDLYRSGFRNGFVDKNKARIFADVQPMTEDTEEERAEKSKTWNRYLSELREDLENIAVHLKTATQAGQTMQQQMAGQKKRDVTAHLVRYGRNGAEYFHTPDRKPYAAVKVGDHTEHYEIKKKGGGDFAYWLEQAYWDGEEQRLSAQSGPLQPVKGQEPLPDVVRDRDLADAVRTLRGLAVFKGSKHEVFRRLAGHEGKVYIDLCDEEWRVVEVDGEGWRVIPGDDAPVRFSRKPGMLELTEPERGGSLQPLRDLLHLGEEDQERRNWHLIVAWLVQALSPYGAYSVLSLFGNQGSGKSGTQGVLRNFVDPNEAPLRPKPREERDLFIAASNSWTISLENMSKVTEWLSNALCVIATSGSYGIRAHYEDDEEVLFKARRPVLINGIGDILTYPDLLDRAAIVRLPAFDDDALEDSEERLEDDVLIAVGRELAPTTCGALLDCLSYYLANRDSIPNPRTRMVTYAKFGVACEQYLGWGEGAFMRSYKESRGEATAQVLDSMPIAAILLDFLEDYPKDDPWEGTPGELLADLNSRATETLRRDDEWPSSASRLGVQLNKLATDLARAGVQFTRFYIHGTTMFRLWKKG